MSRKTGIVGKFQQYPTKYFPDEFAEGCICSIRILKFINITDTTIISVDDLEGKADGFKKLAH